jgi:hypothetical protein
VKLRKPIIKGALKALIGVIVAIAVSSGVFVFDGRYWGSDLSQSVLVQFPGGGLGVPSGAGEEGAGSPGKRPAPTHWAFVDIGPRFCADHVAGLPALCPPRAPRTDPDAVAQLIGWVAAARPRLIVVDITSVQSEAERGALERRLPAMTGSVTAILVTWPSQDGEAWRSGSEPVIIADRDSEALVEAPGRAPIRFLPALIRASVPTSRLLLPQASIAGGQNRSQIPSLSFGAALVARARGNAPIRILDDYERLAAVASGPTPCGVLASIGCRELYSSTERVFSFAPVPPADEPGNDVEARRISANGFLYLYLPAPLPGDASPPPQDLTDSVVVIGDSREAAGDRHWTALGYVSGAEIHLNDIRQFSISPPAPRTGFVGYMLQELPYLLIGLVIAGLVHVYVGLRRLKRAHPAEPEPQGLLARMSVLLVIGLATIPAFSVYVYYHIGHGELPDFVTPYLALFCGGTIEAIFRVISWIEFRFDLHE